jgi:ABC-2 type transport system permease protein
MSRIRAIRLVAMRELIERGRSRAFLISLITTVVLLGVGAVLPSVIGNQATERLGVVGTPPAQFATDLSAVASAADLELETDSVTDESAGQARVTAGSLSALLVVAPDGTSARYNVKQREKQHPNRDTAFLFANVGVVLLFISIFTFGYWVLSGVVEEKQSRVVEVVLATVEARDLLIGKVIGIGLLGLGQLVVMVAVGLSLGLALGRFTLPPTTASSIVQLLLWFILGYALYSTALGALGALASRIEEASNAATPVTFVAMGAYFFSLIVVIDDPGGLPARIGSFIPPVAPMVVPLRAALGAVEPWEVILAAAITLAAIWEMFVLGGRIYSGAVLRTGGRIRLQDAWRASSQ